MAITSNQDGTFDVPRIMKDLHKSVTDTVQDCAQDLLALLVSTNPVDVSDRADAYVSREEWQVALNTYTSNALDSSVGKGGLSGSVGGAGIDLATSTKFRSATSQGSSIDSFDSTEHVSITLYNPAPYMAKLNDGYSPQAPPHWIENCVDQIISKRRG